MTYLILFRNKSLHFLPQALSITLSNDDFKVWICPYISKGLLAYARSTIELRTSHYLRGGGGATKWQGRGASEVLPQQKDGAEKSFSHAEGGGGLTKGFGVVLTQQLDVLAILKGCAKSVHLLKGGGGKRKTFWTSLPVIKDRSLIIKPARME